jgi:glucose-1-phosphate adenylyltransferase
MAFAPREQDANRFGIGELNTAGQIVNFTEKPELPRSNLASMSVYVFRRQVLAEELLRAVAGAEEARTFQIHELLRRMMPRRKAYGYIHHGIWRYTRTLDEYHAFHRDLLSGSPQIDLAEWQVRSNTMARRTAPPVPARILPRATVDDSLIGPGCVIEGMVQRSVLSPGVHVKRGAVVVDSVLWNDVVVEEEARLDRVISDKRTLFGKRCQVGVGESAVSLELPGSLTCGTTVLGMDARVPAGARIGRGCLIHPESREADIGAGVESGKSVRPSTAQKAVSP